MKLDRLLGHGIWELGLAALDLGPRVYCLILASGLGFGSKIQASGIRVLPCLKRLLFSAFMPLINEVCSSQRAQSL